MEKVKSMHTAREKKKSDYPANVAVSGLFEEQSAQLLQMMARRRAEHMIRSTILSRLSGPMGAISGRLQLVQQRLAKLRSHGG